MMPDHDAYKIDRNARGAGLEVMGMMGVLGILWNRETVPLGRLASLTPDQIGGLYERHIAPAIDEIENELNGD